MKKASVALLALALSPSILATEPTLEEKVDTLQTTLDNLVSTVNGLNSTVNGLNTTVDNIETLSNDNSSALTFLTTPACKTIFTFDLPVWNKGGSSNRKTVYYVTNTATTDVDISVSLTLNDGTVYDESTESQDNIRLAGGFSSDSVVGLGETLGAKESGSISITSTGSDLFGYGSLTWTSGSCIQSPLLVSVRRVFAGKQDSWFELNDGKRL